MRFSTKYSLYTQSAKYLDVLSKGYDPAAKHSLTSLKQVLSTGSPLKPELFVWVYEHIKKDLLLGSITGGEFFRRWGAARRST